MSTTSTHCAPPKQTTLGCITNTLSPHPIVKEEDPEYNSESTLESSWLDSSFTTTSTASIADFANQTLNESDWEDIFEAVDYASPDISKCLSNHIVNEASQELDVTGREFLTSPAIPLIGGMPAMFGDIPFRNHPVCLVGQPDHLPFKLQESRRAERTLPSISTLPGHNDPNYIRLRPLLLRTRTSMTGKSARIRLFSNSDEDELDQENKPPNTHCYDQRVKKRSTFGKSAVHDEPYEFNRTLVNPTPNHQARYTGRAQTVRKSKNCSIPGCLKGARSKGLCKRHGGGKRCMMEGCTRSDQGGGYCIAHGGGKRCAVTQCSNSAQSRGLCKSHGGGKRCAADGCLKSSQEGGVCRTHGGGKIRKVPSHSVNTHPLC